MFVSNLTFLGPLSSGKTSLLRNLLGKSFRLTEAHTLSISFSEKYLKLADHVDWSPSSATLVYEDELVRIIVDELLKRAKSLESGHAMTRGGAMGGMGMGTGSGGGGGDTPPPLPPIRRRSQSFTDKFSHMQQHSDPEFVAKHSHHRLSGSFEVLESGTPEGKLQLGYRADFDAKDAQGGHHHGNRGHHREEGGGGGGGGEGGRRGFMSRLFPGRVRRKTSLRRYHSDSSHAVHYTGLNQSASSANGRVATTAAPRVSSIPERLADKIRRGLMECTDSSLPVQFFGRLIDMPGAKAFRTVRSLFITDYSLCMLVYDTSKSLDTSMSPGVRRKTSTASLRGGEAGKAEGCGGGGGGGLEGCMEESHFEQILSDFNNLGLHWSHSHADMTLRGQRVILVATHSDKVTSTVSHNNFDQLRTAIKASPYNKYVAMMKYVLSSSSIIERANMDDLKRYIIEVTKKSCRQHVPLKWLRCIRRFRALSEKAIYFITLEDAKRIVSETCDVSTKEEIDAVIRFLHNNHVVLNFSRIHHLCDIVFTSPVWFAQSLSGVFGAAWLDMRSATGTPSRLLTDQSRLQIRGVLSAQLLDFVWKGESAANRRRLLTILHKMDLVCCLGPNATPIAPPTNPAIIAQDAGMGAGGGGGGGGSDQHAPGKPPGDHVPSFTVSSLVVPSVVAEPMPLNLLRMPTFDLEPLHFRFKDGFVPYDVFPRLVTRCIHSYPHNYTLYSNAGVFEVDPSTVLLISESKGRITLNLYQNRESCSKSPEGVGEGEAPTNLDDAVRHPEPPNLDTCMAVQMFLQAAISDIIQQWIPQVDYDLCVECHCSRELPPPEGEGGGEGERERSGGSHHHVVLSQTDNILERISLNCERGSQITIGVPLYSWFGEIPHPHSPEEDAAGKILIHTWSPWSPSTTVYTPPELRTSVLFLCAP